MRVVFDIEADGLENPTKIWVIVCKDIDTGIIHIFREVSDNETEKKRWNDFRDSVHLWIGHNIIGYDFPVLHKLLGTRWPDVSTEVLDTLVLSKLLNYSRDGHSIEDYGLEFGLEKIKFNDWSRYSKEQEEYCVRDVEIAHRLYNEFTRGNPNRLGNINHSRWKRSIVCEQNFQRCVNDLHDNGFGFDSHKATRLLSKITGELDIVDTKLRESFPVRVVPGKEINPRRTKHGTLNRADFRWLGRSPNLGDFNGSPFCRVTYEPYNFDSHKQIVDILNAAGWKPEELTDTHKRVLKESRQNKDQTIDYVKKLLSLSTYGYKVNETNLNTLPVRASDAAKTLAKRIILESRRRTLTEWLNLVDWTSSRIHGKFYGIGAWTQRMAHQNPNTANIPNPTDMAGKPKLYGGELRSLWCAADGSLLVGVDAESIQLRIFAHYIDDKEFTNALVAGRKEDRTDPHSLNWKVLGTVCKSRSAAKRFIFALLLGAGLQKLAQILDCSVEDAQKGLNNLLDRYEGFGRLKRTVVPRDGERGYFFGLDGRCVRIPGDTTGYRKHLAMSGYLQNGEAVVMKHATLLWYERLKEKKIPFKLVDMVHDEWQTECPNDMDIALAIAEEQSKALEEVGVQLEMKCPLKGSYWNEDKQDYTIGPNWRITH